MESRMKWRDNETTTVDQETHVEVSGKQPAVVEAET